MDDNVLALWLILGTIWDMVVFAACGYIVFWKNHSGWWFLFAVLLSYNPTLFEVLKKRFDVEGD